MSPDIEAVTKLLREGKVNTLFHEGFMQEFFGPQTTFLFVYKLIEFLWLNYIRANKLKSFLFNFSLYVHILYLSKKLLYAIYN